MSVNIHEAKSQLSRLVARAHGGETIVIARAGTPVAKLTAVDAPEAPPRRTGFLQGQAGIPGDFDQWAADDIAALFGAGGEAVGGGAL